MKSVTFLAKIFIPFLLIIPKTGNAQSFTLQAGSGFMDVQYSSVVYADVDGDGDPDVLMTGANGGYTCTARMYINNGQGGYTLSTNTFSGVREGVSAFADIDGDGDQDLLITGGLQSGTAIAYLYTNNGSGIFTQVTNSNLVGVTRSTVVFADIDNDGDQDLFVAGSTSTGSVVSNLYANNGSGSFTLVNAGITGFTSSAAAFGDINGDGYKDLFVTGFSSSTNIESRLYLNNGATGGFTQVTTGVPEAVQSGSVLFADMDNDGDLDLMVVGADPIYAKVAKLYRNNGSGAFTLVPGTPFLGAQYGSVSVADVNNDGLKDVLITGYLNPNRRADLYINNGTSGFTLATGMPFIGVTNSSAAFADVDNDGDQDLWIVGQAATGVSSRLYFNNTVPCTTPVVHLGNDTMICAGSPLVLNAGIGGSGYLFSNGAITQTTTISMPGTYSVVVTKGGNCLGYDTIVVSASPAPLVHLGNDTAICPGTAITLNAGNAGSTYRYSNNVTTQTTTITVPGTYSVVVTTPGMCPGYDTIVVTAKAAPVVRLGNDTTLCPGSTLVLNAGNPGSTYRYSNNASTQTTSITAPGTYSVIVSTAGMCDGHDTIVVNAGTLPLVQLGNDTAICPGKTIVLNAGNPGSTYRYSNNATTQTTSIAAAGTYSVVVTNAGGCTGYDTIVIHGGTVPVVNLGNDTALCPGKIVTLNAGNPGSSYLYSNAATSQTTNISLPGTYSVIVTNTDRCAGYDTIVISAAAAPVVHLGNDTTICSNTPLLLNAGAGTGYTYAWSGGSNGQQLSVVSTGTYFVQVTNNSRCATSDTIRVTALQIPAGVNISVSGNAPVYTFNATGVTTGTRYSWLFGDGTPADTAVNPTHSFTANGSYTITLTVTNQCGSYTTRATLTVSGVGIASATAPDATLLLFPNPAANYVQIETAGGQNLQTIRILNSMGAVVSVHDPRNSAKAGIALNHLAAGIYTIRVQTDRGIICKKLEVVK